MDATNVETRTRGVDDARRSASERDARVAGGRRRARAMEGIDRALGRV